MRASSQDVTLVPPSDHSALKERKDMVRKRKPLVPLGEVIEISSDDESPAPSIPNTIVADLRRQIKKLKEVIRLKSRGIRTLTAHRKMHNVNRILWKPRRRL